MLTEAHKKVSLAGHLTRSISQYFFSWSSAVAMLIA